MQKIMNYRLSLERLKLPQPKGFELDKISVKDSVIIPLKDPEALILLESVPSPLANFCLGLKNTPPNF